MKEKQFIWMFWRYLAFAVIVATMGYCKEKLQGVETLIPPVILIHPDSVIDGEGKMHELTTSEKNHYTTLFMNKGDTIIAE